MTFQIEWADEAFASAEQFAVDDRAEVLEVFGAVDQLAQEPTPPNSFSWGSGNLHRLRVGRYRIMYTVDVDAQTVQIVHLGRTSPGGLSDAGTAG